MRRQEGGATEPGMNLVRPRGSARARTANLRVGAIRAQALGELGEPALQHVGRVRMPDADVAGSAEELARRDDDARAIGEPGRERLGVVDADELRERDTAELGKLTLDQP